jgi:hypothetical protein
MDDERPVTRRDLDELRPEFRQELQHFVDSINWVIRDTETKLLTAFHGYAKGTAARIQRTAISEAAHAARIEASESRVLELETRQGL